MANPGGSAHNFRIEIAVSDDHALVRGTDAQVLVLDLSMPGRNGIELIGQIKDEKPALSILVLTMHAERQYAVRAFRAGASGYMTKESASAELVAGLTKIASGGVYVSLVMAEQFARSLHEPGSTIRTNPERWNRRCRARRPTIPM